MMYRVFIFLLIPLTITACGGTQIKKETLSNIRTINIHPNIERPEEPYIQGKIDPISGFLLGPLGAGFSSAMSTMSAGEIFNKFMSVNNINIATIVNNEYKKTLIKSGRFKVSNKGDAVLKLKINTFGYGNSDSFSDNNLRRPLLNIEATLIQNNQVIWSKTEYVTNMSDLTTAYNINDLANKPDLLIKSYSEAASVVAKLALSELLIK